jgi:hypothetical protein
LLHKRQKNYFKMKKLYNNLWVVVLLAMTTTAAAQLQVQLIVPPMNSTFSNFVDNSANFRIVVVNSSNQAVDFLGAGQLKLDGSVVGGLSKEVSPRESVPALSTRSFPIDALFQLSEDLELNDNFLQTVLRTGYFPSGVYEWCFGLYDANNPDTELVPFTCRSQFVTTYAPPVLAFPNDEATVSNRPIFRWSPVTPAFTGGLLTYQVQIFEIMTGQDALQAFRTNQPILERTAPTTQLMWPMEIPMTEGAYIWTVRAFDAAGNAIGSPQQFAEPFRFTLVNTTATSGSVSSTSTVPVSAGQFIRIRLSSKTDPTNIVHDVIANSTDEGAIRRAFDLSDQAKDYNLSLSPEFSLKSNEEIAEPIYNVFGDVVSYRTIRDDILTFANNSDNQPIIGWSAPQSLKNTGKLPARDRIVARRRRGF